MRWAEARGPHPPRLPPGARASVRDSASSWRLVQRTSRAPNEVSNTLFGQLGDLAFELGPRLLLSVGDHLLDLVQGQPLAGLDAFDRLFGGLIG
jgi:hypothetical protein